MAEDSTDFTRQFGCGYCHRVCPPSQETPAIDDDEAWKELAKYHAPDCEWLVTKDHKLPLPG